RTNWGENRKLQFRDSTTRVLSARNIPGEFVSSIEWKPEHINQMAIVFDFTEDLRSQISRAWHTVDREQTRLLASADIPSIRSISYQRRPPLEKLPIYLRVLDALAEFPKIQDAVAQLADVIYQPEIDRDKSRRGEDAYAPFRAKNDITAARRTLR